MVTGLPVTGSFTVRSPLRSLTCEEKTAEEQRGNGDGPRKEGKSVDRASWASHTRTPDSHLPRDPRRPEADGTWRESILDSCGLAAGATEDVDEQVEADEKTAISSLELVEVAVASPSPLLRTTRL